MTKKTKPDLSQLSNEELRNELARRAAERLPENPTMTDMEFAVDEMFGQDGPPSIALMLSRIKPEKPTAKRYPWCGRRVPGP